MHTVFIRLFAELPSTPEATELAERLRRILLAVFPAVAIATVREYWKISEYQEVCFRLEGHSDPMIAFPQVLEMLGEGWELQPRKGDAIWNWGEGAVFVEPAVRWAHVEVIE